MLTEFVHKANVDNRNNRGGNILRTCALHDLVS